MNAKRVPGRARAAGPRREPGRPVLKHAVPAGISLPVKFALVMSVTIAALMTVFGFVTYSTSRNALNREIDAFGVNLARALALPEPGWWTSEHGTLLEAVRRIAASHEAYPTLLEERFGITYRPPAAPEETAPEGKADRSREYRHEYSALRKEISRAAARNRERLRRLTAYGRGKDRTPSEIIDAFLLYEDQDKSVIRANPEARTFQPTSRERPYTVECAGGTLRTDARIRHGRFEDVGPARSYSYPVRDPRGKITHRAYVFLSEERIQRRLHSLLLKILLCTAAFIAVGAAVAFLLARKMTAPLRDLMDDIEIVSSGDFEHRTRAHSSDEIGLLARTFDRMVRSLHEAQSERSAHQALRHEVAVASEVRDKLIPRSIPHIEGFEVEVLHQPAGEIGGGYYDFLGLGEGRTGVVVAEGSGTGIPAALTVVMARSLLRSEAERSRDPAEILRRANAALSRDIRRGMYVTVLLAVLDPRGSEIPVFGAGNVSLYHFRASENRLDTVVPEGIALGFDTGAVFERSLEAAAVPLAPGDRIVLANRGPAALRNPEGEELGEKRWIRILERAAPKNSSAFVNIVGGTLARFRGESPPVEDIIVVTVKAATARERA